MYISTISRKLLVEQNLADDIAEIVYIASDIVMRVGMT